MFRKLIVSNRFFIRSIRDLFKNTTTPTSPSGKPGPTSTDPFPYKFGGVENYPSHEPSIEVIGRENKLEFGRIYGNLLDSIEKKDKAFFQDRVQNRLIQPLLSGSVKQINRQSTLEFLFFNLTIGFLAKFESGKEKIIKMMEKDKIKMFAVEIQNHLQLIKYMSEGIPVIISYDMAVKSSRKLVPASGQDGKKGSQVHLLTMQQQNKLEFSKISGIFTNPSNYFQNMQKIRKVLLDSKQPWKIGNIDGFLPKRY